MEQFARSLHDGRQGCVGVERQELLGIDDRRTVGRQRFEQRIEPLGADHVDAIALDGRRPAATHQQGGRHRAIGAGRMVGAQVAGVTHGLVDRRLGSVKGALQLEHRDTTALQHDDIGSARVARQLVLQDHRVFASADVAHFELAALALKPRDGLVQDARERTAKLCVARPIRPCAS